MSAQGQPQPWEFQPGIDTGDTFAGFQVFLSLPPPRKLKDVATLLHCSYGSVTRWAADTLWKERALAWDRHCHSLLLDEQEALYRQTAREVAQRHLGITQRMFGVVETELTKLHSESQSSGNTRLTARDITRMADVAIKNERLVRGQATEIVSSDVDLSKLSDEELALLDTLMNKARPG
jgi:hypothetical protein